MDWIRLLAGTISVMGLALAVSALSFARWEAKQYQQRLTERLSHTGVQIVIGIGGSFFCLGQAALARGQVASLLWLVGMIVFIALLTGIQWQRRHRWQG